MFIPKLAETYCNVMGTVRVTQQSSAKTRILLSTVIVSQVYL